jgi:hypothetical protein
MRLLGVTLSKVFFSQCLSINDIFLNTSRPPQEGVVKAPGEARRPGVVWHRQVKCLSSSPSRGESGIQTVTIRSLSAGERQGEVYGLAGSRLRWGEFQNSPKNFLFSVCSKLLASVPSLNATPLTPQSGAREISIYPC